MPTYHNSQWMRLSKQTRSLHLQLFGVILDALRHFKRQLFPSSGVASLLVVGCGDLW